MAAKCTRYVHFRLHMYANSTWLNCATQNDKPCADGVHTHSKMNAGGTFGGLGMGGRHTTASLSACLAAAPAAVKYSDS